jgi:hypothetical protein
MTLETLAVFKIKRAGRKQDLPPGSILTVTDRQGWKLLAMTPEKIRRVDGGPCFSCQTQRFWISVYGAVICGECHPPVSASLVDRWIG